MGTRRTSDRYLWCWYIYITTRHSAPRSWQIFELSKLALNWFLFIKTAECENNLHDDYSMTASETNNLQGFQCNKPRNRHHNNPNHGAITCSDIRNFSIPTRFLYIFSRLISINTCYFLTPLTYCLCNWDAVWTMLNTNWILKYVLFRWISSLKNIM